MKLCRIIFLAVLLGRAPSMASAQLQILPDQQPQCVFCGAAKKINILWHNADNETANVVIHAQIIQTSSATVIHLGEVFWKKLQVLPQQTVVEPVRLNFPEVKAATKFLIRWIGDTNQIFGTTEVQVYPTNLLAELKPLLGGERLGVLDPNNEIKPLLKQNGVEFLNLEEMSLEDFSGRLAIVGPYKSKSQMREGLAQTVKKLAVKGVSMVWLQPPPDLKDEIKPSYWVMPTGKGAVVIVQPDLVSHFPENPQSQLNLIYFCQLALNPQPPILKDLSRP